MTRTLPLHIVPKADEPILGYLQRVCEENAIPNTGSLLMAAGLRPETPTKKAAFLGDLAELVAVPQWKLEAMSYTGHAGTTIFFGSAIWDELVMTRQRRICTRCIAQDGYHKAFWDISVVSVCPIHRTPFLTWCWSCREPLTWKVGSPAKCQCGADYRNMRPQMRGLSPAENLIWNKWRGEPSNSPELLADLNFGDTATTLYHLGWFTSGKCRSPRPIAVLKAGRRPSVFLNRGYECARTWPTQFHASMERTLRRRQHAHPSNVRWIRSMTRWIDGPRTPDHLRPAFRAELRRYK
jgi:hypothetical protein